MTDTAANWVSATPADTSAVLGLMRAFYAEELLVFEDARIAKAVNALLGSPEMGAVFLLKQADEARGYFIVTLAFSVEFGGRFVLLDELYISPPSRGTGQFKHALTAAESWTRHHHIPTLRLERKKRGREGSVENHLFAPKGQRNVATGETRGKGVQRMRATTVATA